MFFDFGVFLRRLLALLQGGAAPSGAEIRFASGKEAAPEEEAAETLERIAVTMRGQVRVAPVERVDYFEAEGNYVRLHAGEETHLISDTLSNLEDRLDPGAFFRIHRSTIVRLDRAEALLKAPGGDYAVRLAGGTRLDVARGRRDALTERLGIAT